MPHRPYPQKVTPDNGDPDDRFTVVITGDELDELVACDFGAGIMVCNPPTQIAKDTWKVKIEISPKAAPGSRDVIVTNSAGLSGTLKNGFHVN